MVPTIFVKTFLSRYDYHESDLSAMFFSGRAFILVVMNMFRFSTVPVAGLPFPSMKRQTRNVKTGLNGIMESEHIYDMGYK